MSDGLLNSPRRLSVSDDDDDDGGVNSWFVCSEFSDQAERREHLLKRAPACNCCYIYSRQSSNATSSTLFVFSEMLTRRRLELRPRRTTITIEWTTAAAAEPACYSVLKLLLLLRLPSTPTMLMPLMKQARGGRLLMHALFNKTHASGHSIACGTNYIPGRGD